MVYHLSEYHSEYLAPISTRNTLAIQVERNATSGWLPRLFFVTLYWWRHYWLLYEVGQCAGFTMFD